MDNSQLATKIATQVVSDTQFWIAIIGIGGAIVGSLLTMLGNILIHYIKDRPQRKLDKCRIDMLIKMLDSNKHPERWRNLSTLSAVIGTEDEETKRLLFKANARGSEKADGKWGLVKNHPLP